MEDALKGKLEDYSPPQRAVDLVRQMRIVFLVGVSGAGKDTIVKALVGTGNYHCIVSHTTRKPRLNHGVLEKDGENYHFIAQQKALDMLNNGEFVEAKIFSDNVYGTSVAEIEKAKNENKIAITEIEVQGVAEYRKIADNAIFIFLLPPDFETWQKRLAKRYEGKTNQDDIKKRMDTAKKELNESLQKSYFEYVVNKDFKTTVEIVDKIARGHHSDKKNQEAREIARQLLLKL